MGWREVDGDWAMGWLMGCAFAALLSVTVGYVQAQQPQKVVVFTNTDPAIKAALVACGFELVPPDAATVACVERDLAGLDTTGCLP